MAHLLKISKKRLSVHFGSESKSFEKFNENSENHQQALQDLRLRSMLQTLGG